MPTREETEFVAACSQVPDLSVDEIQTVKFVLGNLVQAPEQVTARLYTLAPAARERIGHTLELITQAIIKTAGKKAATSTAVVYLNLVKNFGSTLRLSGAFVGTRLPKC